MRVDVSKLYKPNDRNTMSITLNMEFAKEYGFKPNSYVQVIYDKKKITIVEDMKDV